MQNLLKLFGASVAGLGFFAFVGAADAADGMGRAGYNVRSSVSVSSSSQRMPTMPTLPGNSIGNLSPNLPTNSSGSDTPNKPDPKPEPECPDGGVKNSDYTVENCMNDILTCVNNGALPGGLNDLFNEDLRNAIVNGMGLCQVQVERCITEVRKNCENVYRSSADVWIDFNARKVQPEYYSFVLRKTGLTPNQAENTCMLLDKNTYGSSFNAVSNSGTVTAEYNERVGAYNSQSGNVLIKNSPQGVQVNDNNPGVDGQRGHYARWDATTAECWIRVAAYNKDEHIKNSWLFGALGDDQPAEVWKVAGDTFTCNKDLFGFSLMNQTSTAAVVGVGGGTLVGVGIGAIAGHGARDFDCSNKSMREKLSEEINPHKAVLRDYLPVGETLTFKNGVLDEASCRSIVTLYDNYERIDTLVATCEDAGGSVYRDFAIKLTCDDCDNDTPVSADLYAGWGIDAICDNGDGTRDTLSECANNLVLYCQKQGYSASECYNALSSAPYSLPSDMMHQVGSCWFKPLDKGFYDVNSDFICDSQEGCVDHTVIRRDLDRISWIQDIEILRGEKSNMGKSIGIGAGVGAGAGGLATAITAFVERNNISCRIGDGLAQVGFGKSYSIGSLKDFYVKWNLRLPDTIAPTAQVADCDSWKRACATLTDLNQCKSAQINYKPADAETTTLVRSACAVSGSTCIENYPVARSYGACK